MTAAYAQKAKGLIMRIEMDLELREQHRTCLFVMAVLSTSSGTCPVKIRNISPNGALIEGAALPAPKERVRLRRGNLAVTGELVWRNQGQAGIAFRSQISVIDWLPRGKIAVAQQNADQIFQNLKVEGNLEPSLSGDSLTSSAIHSQQLATLADAIEDLAEDLASDDAIIARHFAKLQTLDIATQVFRRLSAKWVYH